MSWVSIWEKVFPAERTTSCKNLQIIVKTLDFPLIVMRNYWKVLRIEVI